MAHELASAFQQALRIGNLGAAKETNVDVRFEGIHVGKGGVADTRGRMAIMQQLSNVVSAAAHGLKPAARDRAQSIPMLVHPDLDRGVSLNGGSKSEKLAHSGVSGG